MVRLLFFLYELPARLVQWSQKQNNQATMPKLRYRLQLFLFAGALQCTSDLLRLQSFLTEHSSVPQTCFLLTAVPPE